MKGKERAPDPDASPTSAHSPDSLFDAPSSPHAAQAQFASTSTPVTAQPTSASVSGPAQSTFMSTSGPARSTSTSTSATATHPPPGQGPGFRKGDKQRSTQILELPYMSAGSTLQSKQKLAQLKFKKRPSGGKTTSTDRAAPVTPSSAQAEAGPSTFVRSPSPMNYFHDDAPMDVDTAAFQPQAPP